MNLLLTGSSSGIGRHLAARLLQSGHQVWGLARSSQADFQRACQAAGQTFRCSTCDVSDWEQVRRARDEVGKEWAGLHGVICCAGMQPPIGPAMEVDPVAWSRNLRLNLDGTYFTIRAFHDLLLRAPSRAKVICFSGGGATGPRPGFSAYAAAKAGVVRLVETLAAEWKDQPVDINAIAPGAIFTKMTEEVIALGPEIAGAKEYASALELKAKGDAPLAKAAGLVEYLLSPDSDGITGRLLSAPWDPWRNLARHQEALQKSDIYTLRRITPEDRGQKWD